jgi:hypothetical protein
VRISENKVLRKFDLRGQKQPRTSEKYTRALRFVFVASITEVDQTEKNWYMGHVKCKGKTRKSLKI